MVGQAEWEREFERWLEPFLAALGDARRRRWAPAYLRGLLGPGERKSIEPLAARTAPGDYQQVHHFVCGSCWNPAPLERVLAQEAQRLVGGPEAVLIVDDTALLKQGTHSVGVARQYAGAVGKKANCQVLVSLTLARGEVPVCVALRLFLPAAWAAAPERCRAADAPAARLAPRSKPEIALEELDRLRAAGVQFGVVLADAGYGMSHEFRRGLSARGLTWAVGVLRTQLVYPTDVRVHGPRRAHTGRPPTRRVPTRASERAADVLARARWRRLTWRDGTKGPLAARFAAVRVRLADGALGVRMRRLPGEEVWLVGEERGSGERKYYLTNHPPAASLRALAAVVKARWACEQAHQQLKEELGLDHFEGRSWTGLHHHALMTMISFAFLQHLRLRAARGRGKNEPRTRRPTARADTAGSPAHTPRLPRRRPAPLSEMPRAADLPAARLDLAE
jgi:SRSO17 transposase